MSYFVGFFDFLSIGFELKMQLMETVDVYVTNSLR